MYAALAEIMAPLLFSGLTLPVCMAACVQDFHLPTAIALGCCSFEAYNAPYCSYGVKEVSPCTSQIIFTDHDFLAKRIQGVLEVRLYLT